MPLVVLVAGFNLCTNTLSNKGFKLLTFFKKDWC